MAVLSGSVVYIEPEDWSNSTVTVTRTDATTAVISPSTTLRVDIPATVTGNVTIASDVGTSVVKIGVADFAGEAIVYGGKLLRGACDLQITIAAGTPVTLKQAAAADYALASW